MTSLSLLSRAFPTHKHTHTDVFFFLNRFFFFFCPHESVEQNFIPVAPLWRSKRNTRRRHRGPWPAPTKQIMNMRSQFIFLVTELQQLVDNKSKSPKTGEKMWKAFLSVGRNRGWYLTERKEVLVESGCVNEEGGKKMQILSQYSGRHWAAVAATVESQARGLRVWFPAGLFLEFACSVALDRL